MDALRLAGEIVARLGRPIDLGGTEVSVGASVGLACAPRDGSDAPTPLSNADAALYRAKWARRNHVASHEPA